MAPALLAVVLASAVAAPAPPEGALKMPQGPPPTQVVASVTKDGEFEITQPRLVAEMRTEQRTKTVDGNQVTYTVKVVAYKPVEETRRIKAEGVKVYTTAGKEVLAKDVPDKLKKPTLVLLSVDGKEVDPFYLKIIKSDTLVIVAPPPVAPAPAVVPKPPAAGAGREAAAKEEAARAEAAKRAAAATPPPDKPR